jgi:hypothetical protein
MDSIFIITKQFIFITDPSIVHGKSPTDKQSNPSDSMVTQYAIPTIQKIMISAERDNSIVIQLPDYKTELLMLATKVEAVTRIAQLYEELTNEGLEIEFKNVIEFPVAEDTMYIVEFVRVENGVQSSLFCKSI